jgi:alpha-glucuronidase
MTNRIILFIYVSVFIFTKSFAESGYELWQRYTPLSSRTVAAQYQVIFKEIGIGMNTKTHLVIREELNRAIPSLLGISPEMVTPEKADRGLVIDLIQSPYVKASFSLKTTDSLGSEGFLIKHIKGKDQLIVTANTPVGLLYGTFHLLRLMSTESNLENIHILSTPKIGLRMLNHWDNLTRLWKGAMPANLSGNGIHCLITLISAILIMQGLMLPLVLMQYP